MRSIMAIEKRILTAQKNGPYMGLVQDGLLGTFLLTNINTFVSKDIAFDCMCFITNFNFSEFIQRAKIHYDFYIKNNTFKERVPGRLLFSALFPSTFSYNRNGIIIEEGIILPTSEPLHKDYVGPKGLTVHHFICIEYSEQECVKFLSESQFVINNWLHTYGFSVGITDFFIDNYVEIEKVLSKMKVEVQEKIELSSNMLEEQINFLLNSAVSVGLRLSKTGLRDKENNRLVIMSQSGAKGTHINISQITVFVGQQNVDGKRIPQTLTRGTRTLPYFAECDNSPEARGFVSRSYFDGLTPQQAIMHSMAGREGIIDTALRTAKSGYIQRRIVKKVEDLKVSYDGTVRSNTNQIVEFLYGKDGKDGARIFQINGMSVFVDPVRISLQLNSGLTEKRKKLTTIAIEKLCSKLKINNVRSDVVLKAEKIEQERFAQLLKKVEICPSKYKSFIEIIEKHFRSSLCAYGESVGVLSASCIGEPTTQASMKNWDPRISNSSKKTTTGIVRLEELLGATKNTKTPSCLIYVSSKKTKKFDKSLKNTSQNEVKKNALLYLHSLRKHIQYTNIEFFVLNFQLLKVKGQHKGSPFSFIKQQMYVEPSFVKLYKELFENHVGPSEWVIELNIDVEKLTMFDISLEELAEKITQNVSSATITCIPSPNILGKILIFIDFSTIDKKAKSLELMELINENNLNYYYTRDVIIKDVLKTYICGIDGISNVFFDVRMEKDKMNYLIDTQGTNLSKVLALPFCDTSKTISDDIWDVYNTLGIAIARKTIALELTKALCSDGTYIDKRHIELLVSAMTYQGTIMPVRREGIDPGVGVLAKCAFEKTAENFCTAGVFGERDDLSCASSRIVVGELIKGGTGYCDILPNYKKAEEWKAKVEFEPQFETNSLEKKTAKDVFMEKLNKWY